MPRIALLTLIALTVATACADRGGSAVDSAELARDLALANQAPAVYPEIRDTALTAGASETKAAPPPRTTSPARQRTTPAPRPRPVEVVERPVERPEPAPAPPAPAPSTRGFDAGTTLMVSTRSPICTTHLPGDKIVATLDAPVIGTNGATLPAGTTVVLEVASVTPGDTPEAAQISLRVRSIMINDEPVNADASVQIASALERREVPRDKGSDRRKVVGGAIAGAVIGQIMGRDTKSTVIGAAAGAAAGTAAAVASRKYDACLPAGGTVRVTTTRQITLAA